MAQNQAAWSKEKQAPLRVEATDIYEPGPDELLVKVEVIGLNPIESKQQRMGIHPVPYPNISGFSYAGTVETVGHNVQGFKKGDHIAFNRAGHLMADPRFGSFQKFALASTASASKLPDSVPLEAGAAVILNLATITVALTINLGLERPPLSGTPAPKGKKILIYGGTSSCGGLAVNFAVSAGYEVVTTSSPQHHDFVQSLGPKSIIDHTQPRDTLLKELKENGPYDGIFDTIGTPPVTNVLFDYVESVGGGIYYTVIPPVGREKPNPPNVERKFAPYGISLGAPENKELSDWFYGEYLPKGLESGLIIPTRPQIAAGGLDGLQQALDLMGDNKVSGHKLLLYPWGEP